MITRFAKKISLLVEVESTLQIEDAPGFIESKKPSTEPPVRKSFRQRKAEEAEELEKLKSKIETSFNVKVTQKRTQITGEPSSSRDISIYARSFLSVEMFYLRDNLKEAIEQLIENLVEESRIMILTYEIPEDEYEKLEDIIEIPDKFKANKNKQIKKVLSKIETNMRKRINILGERGRPKKSKEKRNLERTEAKIKIQNALRKLISDNESPSKTAAAKILGIGGGKNQSQSMRDYLNIYGIDWSEEVAEAKKNYAELKY